ncbi:MAG: hypothetical protein RIR17_925, partial [Planctomycetota bacterium]
MCVKSRWFFLLLFLAYQTGTKAQNAAFSFDHLTLADGLSQSSVNCLLQDRSGFLWIGTNDGLNRFDGFRFKVYKNIRRDSTSIPGNHIDRIWEDSLGHLWIYGPAGTSIFFPEFEKFYRVRVQGKSLPAELPEIYDLFPLSKKEVLLATDVGLISVNCIPGANTNYFNARYWGPGEKRSSVRDFHAGEKKIWVGSRDQGLELFDPASGKALPVPDFIRAKFSGIPVKSIALKGADEVWVGTDQGLYRCFLKQKKIQSFRNIPGNSSSLSGNAIGSVLCDRSGKVWIATQNGLNLFQDTRSNFLRLLNLPFNPRSISANKVLSLLADYAGTLWIGTEEGLNKLDPGQSSFGLLVQKSNLLNPMQSNKILSVLQLPEGFVLGGTEDGLVISSPGQSFVEYYSLPGIPAAVHSLYRDKAGVCWLGASNGLYSFDVATREIKTFSGSPAFEQLIQGTVVQSIWEDKLGNLWLGTLDGLIVLYANRKDFLHIVPTGTSYGLSHPSVVQVFPDESGRIWIATRGGGLHELMNYRNGNPELPAECKFRILRNGDSSNSLSSDDIVCLAQIKPGEIWIGTGGGGLNQLNVTTGEVRVFTNENGLPNNFINAILVDNSSCLWISTNYGLCRFDPGKQMFRNFYKNNGLQADEFSPGAAYRTAYGELFFGGNNGLTVFHPSKIRTNPIPPKIAFTGISIFNKPVLPGPGQPLRKSIQFADTVVLSFRQNYFSIDFAALHFSSPSNNRYKYILEGFDEDWTELSGQGQAVFTRLPSGEYHFRVMASNSDGIWNTAAKEILIIITPPFWQTWTFRIIATLIL